jgi:hypothetical protein
VASHHLQGCSPRLCRLRTDGLAPASKYWTYWSHAGVYGPSKPSNFSSIEAWLKTTASLVGLEEKLGTDPWIGQSTCGGLCQEPFFLGAVESVQICRHLVKYCYIWTTWDTYGLGSYAGRAWKACGVLVSFSPEGYTSIRIAMTLGYE